MSDRDVVKGVYERTGQKHPSVRYIPVRLPLRLGGRRNIYGRTEDVALGTQT